MSRKAAAALLVAWSVLLIGTAAWQRPVAAALRERGLLTLAVTLALIGAGLLVLRLLRRQEGDEPVPWVPLVLALAAGGWLATFWVLPEERIHLAMYAPLGVLAWRTCARRLLVALLLCGSIGALDELVQGLLPERTFDGWDVLANAVAGTAGVLLARGGRGTWWAPALLVTTRLVLPLIHPGQAAVQPPPEPAGAVVFEPATPAPVAGVPTRPDARYAAASVLLITVDALRADRAPPWGRAAVPTPAFDRLARESVSWEEVHAASIWTTPSAVSLLTGLTPAVHGVGGRGLELAPSVDTPLERLAGAGWATVGFAGDGSETYRHLGFDAELDRDAEPAAEVVRQLRAAEPAFVWMHLRQIHAPYEASPGRLAELGLPSELPAAPILDRARTSYTVPRADFPGRHDWLREPLAALYAAELADADAATGRILDALEAAGLLETTLVLVTADHGEELLDHDGVGHASTTLDSAPQPELVEIPLWLRLPDGQLAGRQLAGRLRQVDVMPTLLPLLGVDMTGPAPDVPHDGVDRSVQLLFPPHEAAPPPPTLVTSSPCGWQCPPERRDERVHALIGHDWQWCRDGQEGCPAEIVAAMAEAEERRRLLRTPVPSP